VSVRATIIIKPLKALRCLLLYDFVYTRERHKRRCAAAAAAAAATGV